MSSLPEKYTAQICELLENSTCFLLGRLEKNGSVYPFIDTKFDIPTGKDFDKQEDFRQKDHIYAGYRGVGWRLLPGVPLILKVPAIPFWQNAQTKPLSVSLMPLKHSGSLPDGFHSVWTCRGNPVSPQLKHTTIPISFMPKDFLPQECV